MVVLLTVSYVSAQEKTTTEEKLPPMLRIGLSPLATSQAYNAWETLTFSYEKPLTSRFTLEIEVSSQFINNGSFSDYDVIKGNGGNEMRHNIKAGMSLAGRYYINQNQYSGHYFAFRVNNILTLSDATTVDRNLNTEGTQRRSLPMLGIYYGYKKTFLKHFFLDAAIGIVPRQQPFDGPSMVSNGIFDGRLTLGFKIPFKKN